MKKTDSSKLWSYLCGRLSVLILAGSLFVACDKEETGGVTPLPDGKYPLQLTAKVAQQPQTRAGGKETWTGGEEIGVTVEGYIGGMPKTYVMDASGNAVPKDNGNTIYWKNTAEARITAWTPDISNVDISNQREGYADFDLLYAAALGRYDQAVNLRFHHRMAKVEITLAADEGVTDEDIAGTTVTLFGDPKTLFAGGMVASADQSDGEIKPYHDAVTKKYEAVVVPQNMTGKPLIKISIGGKNFTYTPETDAAGKLEAGKRYAYTVTVKANGIDVQAVTSGTWSAGSEEDVAVVVKMINYTAGEVKAGDYIYSDGTTSDGGLRRRYLDDRTPVIVDPKPQPVEGKTVVGIVFWVPKDTDPTNRQNPAQLTDDKIMAKVFPGCTHGLAVSLKNVSTSMKWQYNTDDGTSNVFVFQEGSSFNPTDKADYKPIYVSRDENKWENMRMILGYQNTKLLQAYNDYCRSTKKGSIVILADALVMYRNNNPAPANSTGWYIPSVKELHMLCYKDVDEVYKHESCTETRNIVDASLSVVSGETLDTHEYWSSTENWATGTAFHVLFNNGYARAYNKKLDYRVRAVCAF